MPTVSPKAPELVMAQRLPRRRRWLRATHHVLVEVVHHHPGQPRVAPVAVHEQQLLEVPEVGDGEVAGHDSLWGQSRDISLHPGCQGTTEAPPRAGPCAGSKGPLPGALGWLF